MEQYSGIQSNASMGAALADWGTLLRAISKVTNFAPCRVASAQPFWSSSARCMVHVGLRFRAARIRAGSSSVCFGRCQTHFGPCLAHFVSEVGRLLSAHAGEFRCMSVHAWLMRWPMFGPPRSISSHFGLLFAMLFVRVRQVSVHFGPSRSMLVHACPRFCPLPVRFGPSESVFGPFRSVSDRLGPYLVCVWFMFCPFRPVSVHVGPRGACFGPFIVRLGLSRTISVHACPCFVHVSDVVPRICEPFLLPGPLAHIAPTLAPHRLDH